jgi:hypothetical protein
MALTFEGSNSPADLNTLGVGEVIDIVPIRDLGSNPGILAIHVDGEPNRDGIKAWVGGVPQEASQEGCTCHGPRRDRRHDGLLEVRRC